MSKYLIQSESLTAIADEIRVLSDTEEAMSLSAMESHISEANTNVDTEADLIAQITAALEGKAAGGTQAAPTPTPEISVNSNGLITATAGTKSSTYQLAFQPAKTITPTTASQIAISSGYYTGGDITVAGDSNLVANNIKNGVSIFGISGTYEGSGSGGGDTSIEDLIMGTISSYTNDRITTIRNNAFQNCSNLTTVNFPAVTSIGGSAFWNCSNLTTISFPVATSINNSAFYSCTSLTTVSFPAATSIGSTAFGCCSKLTTISFPAVTHIGNHAFYLCKSLTSVNFPAATEIGSNAFYQCSKLTTASFPAVISIGDNAFSYCTGLTTASFPAVITISAKAFANCINLTTANFPVASTIYSSAFYWCNHLVSLYLTGSSLCTLSNSNAFYSTPIGGYSTSTGTYGSIYVPASLLTSYQTATNWTYFSSRFVGI